MALSFGEEWLLKLADERVTVLLLLLFGLNQFIQARLENVTRGCLTHMDLKEELTKQVRWLLLT